MHGDSFLVTLRMVGPDDIKNTISALWEANGRVKTHYADSENQNPGQE
jgi:hypothetical protein